MFNKVDNFVEPIEFASNELDFSALVAALLML
jgi:hypothetical protein